MKASKCRCSANCVQSLDTVIEEAIEKVKENFTDHVFLEIQRDTTLFRSYISAISAAKAKSGEKGYDTVNSRIATVTKRRIGAETVSEDEDEGKPLSHLIQSFTRFKSSSFLPLMDESI